MCTKHARFWVPIALASVLYALPSLAQDTTSAKLDEPQGPLALDNTAVAVLPLEVRSTDPRASDLAAALYEAILNEIATINGLHVVDPSRALPFAGSAIAPEEMARALGAGAVIRGEVRIRYGRWSAYLQELDTIGHGWSLGAPVGDAASDSVSNEEILKVASRVAAMAERKAFPAREPNQRQLIEELQATVLDTSLSDSERVDALDKLSYSEQASQNYLDARAKALGGYVADALIQIALESPTPKVRAHVWHALAGVADPGLIRPLLESLANDTEAYVREAAADRLVESFLYETDVRPALKFAAENDVSRGVRNHIKFSLLSGNEQQKVLRDVALNASAPDNVRLTAIRDIHIVHGEFRELDHELVVTALEIGTHSDQPSITRWMWAILSDSRDPYLVKPYMELLTSAPNEETREMAAGRLGEFLDHPGVRDALEKAAQDSSLVVREAAAKSLQRS